MARSKQSQRVRAVQREIGQSAPARSRTRLLEFSSWIDGCWIDRRSEADYSDRICQVSVGSTSSDLSGTPIYTPHLLTVR